MFIKFRKKLNKKGFTLIELLIVVAIIGILAAIAIPQFAAYRIRGYNSAAHSDAKNVVTGEEAYFVDNQAYMAAASITGPGAVTGTDATTSLAATLTGAKLSKNVTVKIAASSTTGGSFYTLGAGHTQGDRIFYMESEQGKWKYTSKVAGVLYTGAEVTAATTNEDITTYQSM